MYRSFFGGAILAAACVLCVAVPIGVKWVGPTSPALFRGLAEVGVGLMIAFSVAIASAERTTSEMPGDHVSWIGLATGFGCSGLAGIAVSLALAEHRAAGHANLLDELGLAWAIASIGFLGLFVATLPLMTYRWRNPPPED